MSHFEEEISKNVTYFKILAFYNRGGGDGTVRVNPSLVKKNLMCAIYKNYLKHFILCVQEVVTHFI